METGATRLRERLDAYRRRLSPDGWRIVTRSVIQHHAVFPLVHESPFSRRAFYKPRGYAGDADTLDLAYRLAAIPAETSARGRRLIECELQAGTSRSIRSRLSFMSRAIDEVAGEMAGARMLSIACGHLREAQQSFAMAAGAIAELIAFDNDAASLERVSREQPGVTTALGSVRQVVSGAKRWANLDYVYSSGLYDYLSPRFARTLTRTLFEMLKPGGRLLVANMTPDTEAGYLEAFMDWWMVYRNEDDMRSLADAIPSTALASTRTFRNPGSHIVFLEIVKA